MSTTTVTAKLRKMTPADMKQVVAIEKECGENHWTEKELLKRLGRQGIYGAVCYFENVIVGYMIYEPHDTYFHILNLTVSEKCRRKGVGKNLMRRLLSNCTPRRDTVDIVVRETNLAGQLFLKSLKFECDQIFKEYFGDEVAPKEMRWEDGYHFLYTAPPSK